MHRLLGIPNCYTLECNYNSCKYFNKLEEFGESGIIIAFFYSNLDNE